jgi:hypothetical protein
VVRGARDGGAGGAGFEPESAVVDEGGLAGAWQEFAVHAKWYGKVDAWPGWTSVGTGLVRCTPAMSVSSVTTSPFTAYILLFSPALYSIFSYYIDMISGPALAE